MGWTRSGGLLFEVSGTQLRILGGPAYTFRTPMRVLSIRCVAHEGSLMPSTRSIDLRIAGADWGGIAVVAKEARALHGSRRWVLPW